MSPTRSPSAPPLPAEEKVRRLVAAAQAGDRQAVEELYLLHFDRVFGYLRLRLDSQHDAEDLTTQTFVRMIEALPRFEWRSLPFSAWLFRIAHNLLVDRARARARYKLEEVVPEPPPSSPSSPRSAEEEAAQALGRQGMLKLIKGLSEDQRQVLMLKFIFGFQNREVALILSKSEGAVKSLQHRALQTLEKTVPRDE